MVSGGMNKEQSTKSNTIPIPAHLQQIITETSFACKNDWQIRTKAIRYSKLSGGLF